MNLFTCCGLILFRFKFNFSSFLGEVMYASQFETKENKIGTKNSIETKHKEEPRYNEPVYNVVLGITNNFVYPQ